MDVFINYFIVIVLPILIVVFILLIIILVLNRFKYDLFKPKLENAKSKIDSFLTNLIFSPFDEKVFDIEIKHFKKEIPFEKTWCKKLLLNEIVFLKLNLKGDVTHTFHFLYEKFDLFEYTKRLLNSNRYYFKSLGMYQLEALEYKKGKKYVTPLLNHKNRSVKSSAFLTLISLEPDQLETLIDFSDQITIAEEINIMDILHQKKTKMPTNLSKLIVSENTSIIKLGLKLMVFYNYTNENETIIELLKHPDTTVRFEAILAVKFLFIYEAEPFLIEQFKYEDTENKLEIFNTLSGIGTTDSENFIANLLENKSDENIKLDAVYCLNKINPDYFKNHFVDNEDVRKMVKHVNTPYLK
ncbi:HEAT repeat domain-containing protein [Flavobacterium sp. N3904]|uniref:HEAT repeat domain-containing protein n=1 Tax=Flavobacterium sp. N3904 TaxID=2986835 RepID=UPI002224F082|nr:HEAT repeat domain-containing protein [Flavobacterium sp. N3904]